MKSCEEGNENCGQKTKFGMVAAAKRGGIQKIDEILPEVLLKTLAYFYSFNVYI